MTITYVCDAAIGCTFIHWAGEVSSDDWNNYLDRISADPAFPPGPRMLIDLRSASTELISLVVIERAAERWREMAANVPEVRAALVPGETREKAEHFVELLRHSNLRLGVFHQVSAACEWLDLDQDAAKSALQELRAS